MQCKLCKKETKLCNSHIIPEFFFKPLYDEKHRINVVPLSENQRQRYEQKGIREYLLCKNCEDQMSIYENHVRKVFFGGTEILVNPGNPMTIENINYKDFKLFQLSILWRASISSNTFYSNISLGPHEEKIRKMLIEENPGGWLEYPCLLYAILRITKKEILDDLILPPDSIKFEGHRLYRFFMGGSFWIFFVSSHTDTLELTHFFLTEDGKLKIPINSFKNSPYFKGFFKDFIKYNKV
ncbi:MAG: hypothetical protein U5R06_10690 [candidate division KSB1 bacterium]|nr:hypothetical protein [candidate division KSB1 bacterium]